MFFVVVLVVVVVGVAAVVTVVRCCFWRHLLEFFFFTLLTTFLRLLDLFFLCPLLLLGLFRTPKGISLIMSFLGLLVVVAVGTVGRYLLTEGPGLALAGLPPANSSDN